MAAVGSAVGLGNIWRFPYICGKYGGGAFLLVYIAFVFLIGMVLMMSEFVIGRRSQHTPMKAYESLKPTQPGWKLVGLIGIIACFFILSQYLVLSGWTSGYFWHSITGKVATLGTDDGLIQSFYEGFTSQTFSPMLFIAIFALLTTVIILCGVQSGIEKVCKVLMPMLVVLLLVLCVRSLTLPGSGKGLQYLFQPDFSKLNGEGILAALGQALFSLSVGMGVMVVYGSYVPKKDNIFSTALWITVSDTLIAILAGVAIFPAVFSCGMNPAGGPGLVFQVLPHVFNTMGTMGTIFATIFFLLLAVAALTSAISLLECLTAWFAETFRANRVLSTIVFALITLGVGLVLSLSNGPLSNIHLAGTNLFGFVDDLNSIYLPPICALGTIIFFGWIMPDKDVRDELSNGGKLKIGYYNVFRFLARFVAPAALLVVLISGIVTKF